MKLHREVTQRFLTEEELLTEGLLSSLMAGVNAVKNYGTALSGALHAHKELKTLDGQKELTTANLKAAALEIRGQLQTAAAALSDKAKSMLDAAIVKMGGAKLTGAYTSRNYYRDYLVYTMVKPAAELTGGDAVNAALEKVWDKILGAIITAVTGVPAIDDIKDFAGMASSLIKASGNFATKLSALRPAAP